jgi:REP element-mobilizing transposase RayT
MPDHVHMCTAIPPKHPVASVIGFLKGKSAIAIARLCGKERNFTGEHFWALRLRRIHRRVRIGAGPHLHSRAGRGGWHWRTILNEIMRRATRDA